MQKTHPIKVLGLGCPAWQSPLPPSSAQLLAELLADAEVICGGKAQLRLFGLEAGPRSAPSPSAPEASGLSTPAPEVLVIDARIELLLERLRARQAAGKKITVLAGGDPLFFGIGATLARHFPPADLLFYPAVSSMQEACARLALPWHELEAVSLHGRDWRGLAQGVLGGKALCVLLDRKTSPGKIAAWLLARGVEHYRLHYFAKLQSRPLRDEAAETPETHLAMELSRAARELQEISPENGLVVLIPTGGVRKRPFLGMPDDMFEHSAGLITKQPVRAAILAALRLEPEHRLLELGAGCGSVGLEASALLRAGQVCCVERKPERVRQILANRAKFGAVNVEVLQAEAPACLNGLDGLDGLAAPDRIFIGGGLGGGQGGALGCGRNGRNGETDTGGPDLLPAAWSSLKPGGRLVLSCVLLSSLESSLNFFSTLNIVPEVTSIQAGLGARLAGSIQLKALNQVFILAVEKPATRSRRTTGRGTEARLNK